MRGSQQRNKIFTDKGVSGNSSKRDGLDRAIKQIKHARKMLDRSVETTGSIAALFGVDRTTIWRALQKP